MSISKTFVIKLRHFLHSLTAYLYLRTLLFLPKTVLNKMRHFLNLLNSCSYFCFCIYFFIVLSCKVLSTYLNINTYSSLYLPMYSLIFLHLLQLLMNGSFQLSNQHFLIRLNDQAILLTKYCSPWLLSPHQILLQFETLKCITILIKFCLNGRIIFYLFLNGR